MNAEYSDYLAHHGVKGMKWGIRNDKKKSPDSGSGKWKAKDKRKLSDEELDKRNKRLNKENQYVTNVQNNHPLRKEIKSYAKQIFVAAAVGIAADVVRKKLGSTKAVTFIKECANYKLPL